MGCFFAKQGVGSGSFDRIYRMDKMGMGRMNAL